MAPGRLTHRDPGTTYVLVRVCRRPDEGR